MKKQFLRTKNCLLISLSVFLTTFSGCGSDEENKDMLDEELDAYALFVDGPIALQIGSTAQYEAIFISVLNGETSTTIEWSVTNLSGEGAIATISTSGNLSTTEAGLIKVTATAKDGDGNSYTASLPVSIGTPGAFVVAPGAIIATANETPIQLEAIYLGINSQNLSISYESNNSQVATVSSSGLVSFVGNGEAIITVQASGVEGNPVQDIPVLVISAPDIPLPVAKVEIDPRSHTMFPGETHAFSALVFDGDGNSVTDKTVSWELILEKDEDGFEIEAGAINQSGSFEATAFGKVQIVATVEGVSGLATVFVIPENVIVIDPFSASLQPGSTKQFTAEAYPVSKETRTVSETPLAIQPQFEWLMLDFGIPEFSIGTVNQSGEVTMKQDAVPGLFGFLMVQSTSEPSKYFPGFSLINVAIASDCDCGETNATAHSIEVDPVSIDLALSSGVFSKQINAHVLDINGLPIEGANISYCSDNESVVTVDETGEVVGLAEGSATITVCHGSLSTQVTVTVSF